MGLYDEVRAAWATVPNSSHIERAVKLKLATRVRAHNVAEYYSMDVTSQDDFKRQVVQVMPPFPYTWIEARAPKRHRIESTTGKETVIMRWPPFGYRQAGVLLEPVTMSDEVHVRYCMYFQFADTFLEVPSGDYWRYPFLEGYFRVDKDGYPLDDKIGAVAPPYEADEMLREVLNWAMSIFSDVMLLSLSFMNCKNVLLQEVQPPAPVQTKRQKREHVTPLPDRSYHTILIQPLKAVTARPASTPAASHEPESHNRLHIVRGHFARYTEDKPLFGRPGLFGQFWVPTYVAGKAPGEIETQYEIRVPVGQKQTGESTP